MLNVYVFGGVGGEGISELGLGLGFTNPVEAWEVWDVCMCLDWAVCAWGLWPVSGRVGDVMYVCVVNQDYLCRWQVQLSILC